MFSSAQQSWADIAKRRLYDNAETRLNEAPYTSLDYRASIKEEHSISGTSISGEFVSHNIFNVMLLLKLDSSRLFVLFMEHIEDC